MYIERLSNQSIMKEREIISHPIAVEFIFQVLLLICFPPCQILALWDGCHRALQSQSVGILQVLNETQKSTFLTNRTF